MNIFLIILILHYIGIIIFKPKNNLLNCGIFGWLGADVNDFNKDKFDKLGIFNETRGRSSCGVAYDGDVFIGMNNRKLYSDFIIDEEIDVKKYPIVIGHTRQASIGTSVTIHNAHPFNFGYLENGDAEFIGCHNGTLYNKIELAEKYDVELKAENKEYNNFTKKFELKEREKIDSEILLESIYKNKNFKVLNDYLGGAALFFTNLNEPNVGYLFKGKSKMHSYSKQEEEERPLFVFIENKNSMYVSSIENSLRTIGGNDDNIINIECNVVYKITNGDFINAEKIFISRSNAQQTQRPNTVKHNHFNEEYYGEEYYGDIIDTRPLKTFKKQNTSLLLENKVSNNSSLLLNIYDEKLLKQQSEYKDRICFNKLRFKRNGHPITGVYTFIMGYGYHSLSMSPKKAEEYFSLLIDKPFDRSIGQFVELILNETTFIPFKSENIIQPNLYYFIEGVQVRTVLDYSCFYSKWEKLKKGEFLNYIDLSNIATHPVINYNFKSKPINEQFVTYNGKLYSGSIVPLGSEKNYTFEKGNLIKVKESSYYKYFNQDNNDNLLSSLNEDNLKVEENLFQKNDDELLNELIKIEEQETELINEIVHEDFAEPIQDFQKTKTKLLEYTSNAYATTIINFIDETINKISKLTKI